MKANQHDVARLAGVSQAAVSRVFSGRGYVSKEMERRIRLAAEKLNYEPDMLARSLVTGESNIYALVLGSLLNPFYPYALELITRAIREKGGDVLLFNAADETDLDKLLPLVLRYRVRGALIMTANLSSNFAAELVRRDVPVVFFNRYSRIGDANAVLCDNFQAGQQVAEAFVQHGYSNVGYIGGSDWTSTNHDRKNGFLDGLEKHGVGCSFLLDREFSHRWGMETAGIVAKRYPATEGIFCGDDAIATGFLDGMREILDPPGICGIGVVGVDDIPMAAWPPYSLSTIRQPIGEMIDLALDMLETPHPTPETRLLPGEFIRRRSF